jgi:hypothetical protein
LDEKAKEDTIKMDLKESCWEFVKLTHPPQEMDKEYLLENSTVKLPVAYNAGNILAS